MPYYCIIIDDDEHALEQLTEYIGQLPYLVLIKAFKNPLVAAKEIQKMETRIDILFTDVEMPGLSGLQLIEQINNKFNWLVLVSGHHHYAIDGYSVNAQQFLGKPFSFSKFENTLKNLLKKVNTEPDSITIRLSGKNRSMKIPLDEIIAVEAASNYLKIHTKDKIYVPYGTMRAMQGKLAAVRNFIRISRSVIINTNYIRSTNRYQIDLSGNLTVRVGESYQKAFDLFFKEMIKDISLKIGNRND